MPTGFLPAMQAELQGIQTTRPLRYRGWQGVVADLWHARGASGATAKARAAGSADRLARRNGKGATCPSF